MTQKEKRKQIEELANLLPAASYEFNQKRVINGQDIHTSAAYDNQTGSSLDNFITKKRATRLANHKRRLWRIYKANGKEGLTQYLLRFIKPEHHKQLIANLDKVTWL